MLFASLTDTSVSLRFVMNNDIWKDEHSYELGNALFDFLALDIPEIYALYLKFADTFIDYQSNRKSEKAYNEKLATLFSELDSHSVYLHAYTVDFLSAMIEIEKGVPYALESFLMSRTVILQDMFYNLGQLMADKSLNFPLELDFLATYPFEIKNVDLLALPTAIDRHSAKEKVRMRKAELNPPSDADMRKMIGLAALFIAEDIRRKQKLFLGDIEAITGNDKSLDGLSLPQKLYLLDFRREQRSENQVYNSGALWQTSFVAYPPIPQNLTTENKVRDYILKNMVEIKQVNEITTLEGMIVFELLSLLDRSAAIKKCKYCGNYFVPQGRSDAVFCERIAKGESKPCRMIGALKLHKAAKAENPIHEAYQKAYRRMNAKCRTKRITQNEFFAWSEQAREKRNGCLNGELPLAEFAEWLNSDKAK
jgi:hypothetical protein